MGAQPVWFGSAEPVWVGAVIAIAAIGALLVFPARGAISTASSRSFSWATSRRCSIRCAAGRADGRRDRAFIQEGRMRQHFRGGRPRRRVSAWLYSPAASARRAPSPPHTAQNFAGGALMTADHQSIPGASDVVAFTACRAAARTVIGW